MRHRGTSFYAGAMVAYSKCCKIQQQPAQKRAVPAARPPFENFTIPAMTHFPLPEHLIGHLQFHPLAFTEPVPGVWCGWALDSSAQSVCSFLRYLPPLGFVVPPQKHTATVVEVTLPLPAQFPEEGCDGLVSSVAGVALGVRTADCLPLVLALRDGSRVAVLHAGWRGALAGIAERGLDLLLAGTGCGPEQVLAAMGPCISRACYEVGAEVIDAARQIDAVLTESAVTAGVGGKGWFSVADWCQGRLEACGVPTPQIAAPPACTYENTRLPSWRREGQQAGRLVTWVGRHPEQQA